jgi:hypothetical protein
VEISIFLAVFLGLHAFAMLVRVAIQFGGWFWRVIHRYWS